MFRYIQDEDEFHPFHPLDCIYQALINRLCICYTTKDKAPMKDAYNLDSVPSIKVPNN